MPENFSGFFTTINNYMKTFIRCYTLFDITCTGITLRKKPINLPEEKIIEWEKDRNRQSNFDTLIQVISLRTQPEDITIPVKSTVNFKESKEYGFLFENEEAQNSWTFDFSISYQNVFDDGISDLGLLYYDCSGVPMIKMGDEWDKLPNFLDVTPELRNIYFEVLDYE